MPSNSQPTCYFCGAADSMAPFKRSDRVWLLSWLMTIRWRYCRACTRHFLSFRTPTPQPVGEGFEIVDGDAGKNSRVA